MVSIVKLELTDQIARYRYFPENSKKRGINRRTGERDLEKD